MEPVFVAEACGLLVLSITLLGLLGCSDKSKSTKMLMVCCICSAVAIVSDILFQNALKMSIPVTLSFVCYLISFLFGNMTILCMAIYCYYYVNQKATIPFRMFLPPLVIISGSSLHFIWAWGSGILMRIEGDELKQLSEIPNILFLVMIISVLYLPIVALLYCRRIGIRTVGLVAMLALFPTLGFIYSRHDNALNFSQAAGAFSLICAYVLFQNENIFTQTVNQKLAQENLNKQLRKANKDQEHQLREINQLNQQLEKQKSRLEKVAMEQNLRNKEITSLNAQLQQNQEDLSIALAAGRQAFYDAENARKTIDDIHTALGSASWTITYASDGTYEIEYSDGFRKLLGYENTIDFPNVLESMIHTIYPNDCSRILETIKKKIYSSNLEEVVSGRFRGRKKDGTERWFDVNARISRGADGAPKYLHGVMRDATDLEKAESEKVTALEAMQAIHESLRAASYNLIYDNEGNLIGNEISERYFDMIGYSRDEYLQYPLQEMFLVHPDDAEFVREQILETIRSRDPNEIFDCTYRIGTRHRGYRWFHGTGKMVRRPDLGRNVFYCLIMDITLDREAEQALAEAKEAAEVASVAKSNFLFNMSHDIRTPMNAIVGYSELIKQEVNNPEKVLEYQEKLHKSSEFLLSLINGVLDMARIESGKVELDEEYMEAGHFLGDIVGVFQPSIDEKQLTVKHSENITNKHIMLDITKTREILTNLIGNAVKYTTAGGTITIETREIPCNRKGYVCVETKVSDTGIGISEEFLPTIFDSFTRERNTTLGKISGTGLGLPIVKRLVTQMGGTIEVESKLGEGSTFTLTLTHKMADEAYYRKDREDKEHELKDSIKGKRILLAEDNEFNAEIAIEILKKAGFLVERAEDGIICLDMVNKAEAGYYDLILMDIQMPNMDGYKATRCIRSMEDSTKAAIPIIAMTANAFKKDREDALSAGMNEHLSKPIDISKLTAMLNDILGNDNLKQNNLGGQNDEGSV